MATENKNIQELINGKFIDFCNDIENIEKDGVNPHFKSRYTTLDEIFKKIKSACKKHRCRVINKIDSSVLDNGSLYIEVTPIFICEYGTYEGGVFRCISTNQIQNNGSIITYAKRYTISAFLGIAADEDDDGNAGMESVKVINTAPTSIQQIQTVDTKKIKKQPDFNEEELNTKSMIKDMTIDNAFDILQRLLYMEKHSESYPNASKLMNGYNAYLDKLGYKLNEDNSKIISKY